MNRAKAARAELVSRCDRIDREWQLAGRRLEDFVPLVDRLTEDLDLRDLGDLGALAGLLDDDSVGGLQHLSSFSDLYLKLYDNGYFWVEVLNWWGSDINIHDHDFAAVQFQLAGKSINIDYAFDQAATLDGVHFGEIMVKGAQVWHPGGRSYVAAGRQAPHNVCHLGMPTVSLLIRTYPQPGLGPQFNYFPPSIAASYGVGDVVFRKRVKALRLIASGGQPGDLFNAFQAYLADAPLDRIAFALIKMHDLLFQPRNLGLLHWLVERRGAPVEAIVVSVSLYRATEIIKALRWNDALSQSAQWALAATGSAFDLRSALAIAGWTEEGALGGQANPERLITLLQDAQGQLQPAQARLLRGALQVVGMAGADAVDSTPSEPVLPQREMLLS